MHTAERLKQLMVQFKKKSERTIASADAATEVVSANTSGESSTAVNVLTTVGGEDVHSRITAGDDAAAVHMWLAALPTSSPTIPQIVMSKFSPRSLIEADKLDLSDIKYTNGRIAKAKILKTLRDINKGKPELCIKLISGIRGIGKNTAIALMNAVDNDINRILQMTAEELETVQIPRGKSIAKLGKKAELIVKFLNYSPSAVVEKSTTADGDLSPAADRNESPTETN